MSVSVLKCNHCHVNDRMWWCLSRLSVSVLKCNHCYVSDRIWWCLSHLSQNGNVTIATSVTECDVCRISLSQNWNVTIATSVTECDDVCRISLSQYWNVAIAASVTECDVCRISLSQYWNVAIAASVTECDDASSLSQYWNVTIVMSVLMCDSGNIRCCSHLLHNRHGWRPERRHHTYDVCCVSVSVLKCNHCHVSDRMWCLSHVWQWRYTMWLARAPWPPCLKARVAASHIWCSLAMGTISTPEAEK
jgi:hypothetical protein